jgi:hypothetical protein
MEKSSNSSKIVGDAFRGPSGYETVDEQPLPETRGRVLGLGLLAAAVILCAVVFVAVPSPSSGAGANTHGLAMRCVDNSARVVPRPRTVRLSAAATAPPQVPHVEPRRRLLPVEFGEEPRLLPGRHEHRDGDEDRQGRVRRQQRLRGPRPQWPLLPRRRRRLPRLLRRGEQHRAQAPQRLRAVRAEPRLQKARARRRQLLPDGRRHDAGLLPARRDAQARPARLVGV